MKILSTNDLENFRVNNTNIYLYGRCRYAKFAAEALRLMGQKVQGVFDIQIETTTGNKYEGIPELGQDELNQISKNSTIILTNSYFKDVSNHLKNKGLINHYDCVILFEYLINNHQDTALNEEDITLCKRQVNLMPEKIKHALKLFNSELNVTSIDVIVTEKCTLNCTDCSNLMPYFEKPVDVDTHIICQGITKIASSVDKIFELRVLGGEPFIKKDLDIILKHCNNIENSVRTVVYTNGTIIPNKSVLSELKNHKVYIEITNYNSLSRKLNELTNLLDNEGIKYFVKELWPDWDDSANIIDFQRSPKEDQQIFDTCCAKYIYTFMHGKLFRCPFSASLNALNVIEQNPDDWIEINNNTNPRMRDEIKAFVENTNYVPSCSFCQGRGKTLPRTKAARQSKGKRQAFEYVDEFSNSNKLEKLENNSSKIL